MNYLFRAWACTLESLHRQTTFEVKRKAFLFRYSDTS